MTKKRINLKIIDLALIYLLCASLLITCGCQNHSESEDPQEMSVVVVFADANGSDAADGTRENPMTLSQAVSTGADIIVLLDSGGDFREEARLLPNQWLIGGGDTGEIHISLPSKEKLSLTNLGNRPKIVGVPDPVFATYPVWLEKSNRIQGITIEGGTSSIACIGSSNIYLEDLLILMPNLEGIDLNDCDNALLDNIDIQDGAVFASISAISSDNITIKNITVIQTNPSISDNTGSVLDISGSDRAVIDNIVIDASSHIGLKVNQVDNLEVSNVSIGSSLYDGIFLEGNFITVDNITVSNSGSNGIVLRGADITANNLSSSHANESGIIFDNFGIGHPTIIELNNSSVESATNGIQFIAHYDQIISGTGNSITRTYTLCTTIGDGSITGSIAIGTNACP